MSHFKLLISDLVASISRSSGSSVDLWLDHDIVLLSFDFSFITRCFWEEGPVALLEVPTLLFNGPGKR